MQNEQEVFAGLGNENVARVARTKKVWETVAHRVGRRVRAQIKQGTGSCCTDLGSYIVSGPKGLVCRQWEQSDEK